MNYGNENFILVDMNYLESMVENDRYFNSFSLLFEILKRTDFGKRTLTISYSNLAQHFRKNTEDIKKKLFILRDFGFIEIYKSNIPRLVSIVIRKNEFLCFPEKEIFLDESKILKTPNSKSRNDKGYDKFRKSVLKRDGYTCQLCGSK